MVAWCKCYRRNSDEQYRRTQRELQANNTFENRVNMLRQRLRTGEITEDRVSAASSIGSLEAQAIIPPHDFLGIDWAVSVLGDHFGLKPIVAEAIIHALETFTDETSQPSWSNREDVIRYVTNTFTNPRFDFEGASLPQQGRRARFIEATIQEIGRRLTANIVIAWDYYDRLMRAGLPRNISYTWFLSNEVVPQGRRASEDNLAYSAISPLSALGPEEEAWQRQHLVDWLLGTRV